MCHSEKTEKTTWLMLLRYEVTPNRLLANKQVALDWDSGWKILMEKNDSSEWLAVLNEARTYFMEHS